MNLGANSNSGNGEGRPSLLIADDDAFMRSTLATQLGGDFHIVAVAKSATEAIELGEEHRPDVALIDVQMPDGGARAAVPGILSRSPETCVVVLSADESRRMVLELLDAGAVAYIRKGVTAAQISLTVAAALRVTSGERAPLPVPDPPGSPQPHMR